MQTRIKGKLEWLYYISIKIRLLEDATFNIKEVIGINIIGTCPELQNLEMYINKESEVFKNKLSKTGKV